MNTHNDEPTGFCFRCPAKSLDTEYIRFPSLKSPWPLLVPSSKGEYAKTQPLIHAIYLPTATLTFPYTTLFVNGRPTLFPPSNRNRRTGKHTPKDQVDFRNWFIYLHEHAHIWYFNWTPARDLATLYMGFVYDCIYDLLFEKTLSSVTGVWSDFKHIERQLNKIEKNTAFIEEFFATIMAIKRIENEIIPRGMWEGFQEELKELKEEVRGFQEDYAHAQPLIQLMFNNTELLSFIIPLLQPIQRHEITDTSQQFDTLDTRDNLHQILNTIGGEIDAKTIISRLMSTHNEIVDNWQHLLSVIFEYADKPLTPKWDITSYDDKISDGSEIILQELWAISRGNFDQNSTTDHYLSLDMEMYLQRAIYESPNYIAMTWRKPFLWTPDILYLHHKRLLFYEALREQLLVRKGIICPFNQDKQECQCNKETHKALLRLSHLAVDGLFDEGKRDKGEWFLLPCRR